MPPSVGEYAVEVPAGGSYVLRRATVPLSALDGVEGLVLAADQDGLVRVDIRVADGAIAGIDRSYRRGEASGGSGKGEGEGEGEGAVEVGRGPGEGGGSSPDLPPSVPTVDLGGMMVLPTFVDMHTHIDKGHTGDRSRNPFGSLAGADASTAADGAHWTEGELDRRLDFSLACAYAHGTSALRTHLINMTARQTQLTWPAFARARARWRGRVELQGVSLVALAFYREEEAGRQLARLVAEHGGILGAAVCSTDSGGMPEDDWTTCERDRAELLDRMFDLAAAHGLDLDFHVDENGNPQSRGLRDIALARRRAVERGLSRGQPFARGVVCGHCCSLATRPDAEIAEDAGLAAQEGIAVVSLPLVNEWTQDRRNRGKTARESAADAFREPATPLRRGLTALHELQAAGVRVSLASDNTRDQFYAYGDLDMLQVFGQGVKAGHLDRPIASWWAAVGRTPADVTGFTAGPGPARLAPAADAPAGGRPIAHGRLRVGADASFVVFRARRLSELLARPQYERVVVRGGEPLYLQPPGFDELDELGDGFKPPEWW